MHDALAKNAETQAHNGTEPKAAAAAAATMPDVQNTVVAATETAAARQMPLRPQAMTSQAPNAENTSAEAPSAEAPENSATPDSSTRIDGAAENSAAENSAAALPQSLPWSGLSASALSNLRQVDMAASLRGIEAPMKAVESEIEKLITTPVKLIADLASHTMGAGGKRLRPALVILAAQLCSENPEAFNARVITCAAAVELMHTTSLLHDDVVDSAATRRGKPAANLMWGNETSILVGDYLFAQVFVTVAQKGFVDLMPPIAQATSQLCAGELLETQTRGLLSMKEKQYCDIIALKTAALTECSCRLGAMAVGADDEKTERLARFGREVGMGFQIVDDVFDIVSSAGRVGKPVGNDVREGDITLPMLRAMQVCSESEKAELRAIVGKDPISSQEVERALQILRGCDAVEYSLRVAGDYVLSAKSQLEHFAATPARATLFDIADYVLSRDK